MRLVLSTTHTLVEGAGAAGLGFLKVLPAERAKAEAVFPGAQNYSDLFMSREGLVYEFDYVEAGAESPEAILARVDRGFYMDDQGSFGFNEVMTSHKKGTTKIAAMNTATRWAPDR